MLSLKADNDEVRDTENLSLAFLCNTFVTPILIKYIKIQYILSRKNINDHRKCRQYTDYAQKFGCLCSFVISILQGSWDIFLQKKLRKSAQRSTSSLSLLFGERIRKGCYAVQAPWIFNQGNYKRTDSGRTAKSVVSGCKTKSSH